MSPGVTTVTCTARLPEWTVEVETAIDAEPVLTPNAQLVTALPLPSSKEGFGARLGIYVKALSLWPLWPSGLVTTT
jgi:hypothetical protein